MLSRNNQVKIAAGLWAIATFLVAVHPTWIDSASLGCLAVGLMWLFCYHHAMRKRGEIIFETTEYVNVGNVTHSTVTRIKHLTWFGYKYVRAGWLQDPISFAYQDQAYRFMSRGTCSFHLPHTFEHITKIRR